MVAETEQEQMKEEEDAAQHSQPAKELTGKRSEVVLFFQRESTMIASNWRVGGNISLSFIYPPYTNCVVRQFLNTHQNIL